MSDLTKRPTYIGTVGPNLVLDTRLVIRRIDLHRLAPAMDATGLADYAEKIAHGDRSLALGVQLSCAVDAVGRACPVAALTHLTAAAVIARRIDAARSEGITS